MKRFLFLLTLALAVFGPLAATAATVIGDLNNFDTINDTGQVCYGFEIELDDVVSTDITYTFDWNHYGAPKIREDRTDPLHPRVIIRYESTRDVNGWGANGSFTNPAVPSLAPPSGHTCTDTSVNEGCEHFGVGYYGTPSAIRYNWLVDDGQGGLVRHGTPVGVAAPKFTYSPPAIGAPAQVVAAIPAPAAPVAGKEFGEAFWVKVIKTTTHSVRPLRLDDLISDDADGDNQPDWQNGEPAEVETEWKLLQVNNGANGAKQELLGAADAVADAGEQVTRRYEFYRYGAAANTIDGETGEAMCDEVDPTTDPGNLAYLHGKATMTNVGVTDANGVTHYVNCAAQVVVGAYIGAQMAGFAVAAPLGLIDNLQDGERDVLYTARTVIVGGDTPFAITISGGALPGGMSLDPDSGVLAGTPTSGGDFAFTLGVTDASGATAQRSYALRIAGPAAETYGVVYNGNGSTGGSVPADGNTYAPGATVNVLANTGSLVRQGYDFAGWNTKADGSGMSYPATGSATLAMGTANITLYATWVPWPSVQFGAAAYSASEAGVSITIPVTRTGNTTGTSTVAWATANGTASAGSDYTAASGTLTFNAGVSTLNIVVSIANDMATEADETFTVALSNPAAATLGVPASTTVTIVDNDSGAELVSGASVSGLAGQRNSLTYFHIDVPAGMGSLKVVTSGGAGNVDVYVRGGALPTTTTYACRSVGRTNADTCTVANPAPGPWYVMLRGTSAYTGASLVATYAPPPPPAVQFTAATVGVKDNVGRVSFTVTRTGNAALASSVSWATADGTAVAGTDYKASSGTLTWAAGDATAKTFTVPITSRKGTQSARSFTVGLTAPVNVGLGAPATVTVTVRN